MRGRKGRRGLTRRGAAAARPGAGDRRHAVERAVGRPRPRPALYLPRGRRGAQPGRHARRHQRRQRRQHVAEVAVTERVPGPGCGTGLTYNHYRVMEGGE